LQRSHPFDIVAPMAISPFIETIRTERLLLRQVKSRMPPPCSRDLPGANPSNLPTAVKAANEIRCLPIHPDLDDVSVQRIIDLIRAA
jgi:dTDP-4-amino-4,6-dideoxygalactose transaminase